MSLTFPSAPSIGQTYVAAARTWEWNGTGWKLVVLTDSFSNNFHPVAYISSSAGTFSNQVLDDLHVIDYIQTSAGTFSNQVLNTFYTLTFYIPEEPTLEALRITSPVSVTESGDATAGWNYTSLNSGFVNGGTLDKRLGTDTNGSVEFTVNHIPGGALNTVLGFNSSAAWNFSVANILHGIWIHQDGTAYTANSGSYVGTGVSVQLGDVIRGTRSGSAILWERKRTDVWTTLTNYPSATTAEYYIWLNMSNANSTAFNLRGENLI
jgi:hypothetical protein